MVKIKKIRKNDEFIEEVNGYNYRILGKHFDDFYCEASDEYDEEKGDYINYKTCILTSGEVKKLAGVKYNDIIEFIEE